MSEQSPYERLGVTEAASFEEIQEAKNRLTQQYREDAKIVESIDAAYDAIIMERLRMRQEGKIKVPDRIRFPEKTIEAPANPPPVSIKQSPAWLQDFLDKPSRNELLVAIAIFVPLAGIALFVEASLLPLLLVLGAFANLYLLNRKEHRFGKALLLTLLALLAGVAIGTGLDQLLTNFQFLSAQQLASLVTFLFFWLSSCFLR